MNIPKTAPFLPGFCLRYAFAFFASVARNLLPVKFGQETVNFLIGGNLKSPKNSFPTSFNQLERALTGFNWPSCWLRPCQPEALLVQKYYFNGLEWLSMAFDGF
jgi:hypothetical protein